MIRMAIGSHEEWRGTLVGNDDPAAEEALREHDAQTEYMLAVLKRMKAINAEYRRLGCAAMKPVAAKKPILGQEAICPDGLGRVTAVGPEVAGTSWVQVSTYVGNRECQWAENNVELIDPRRA